MREYDADALDELAELWGSTPEEISAALDQLTRGEAESLLEAQPPPWEGVDTSEPDFDRDDESLDPDDVEEFAELWGVEPEVAEALMGELDDFDSLDMTRDDVREYIDALYEALIDAGYDDLDVSDLWDMYYGYAPKGES